MMEIHPVNGHLTPAYEDWLRANAGLPGLTPEEQTLIGLESAPTAGPQLSQIPLEVPPLGEEIPASENHSDTLPTITAGDRGLVSPMSQIPERARRMRDVLVNSHGGSISMRELQRRCHFKAQQIEELVAEFPGVFSFVRDRDACGRIAEAHGGLGLDRDRWD